MISLAKAGRGGQLGSNLLTLPQERITFFLFGSYHLRPERSPWKKLFPFQGKYWQAIIISLKEYFMQFHTSFTASSLTASRDGRIVRNISTFFSKQSYGWREQRQKIAFLSLSVSLSPHTRSPWHKEKLLQWSRGKKSISSTLFWIKKVSFSYVSTRGGAGLSNLGGEKP